MNYKSHRRDINEIAKSLLNQCTGAPASGVSTLARKTQEQLIAQGDVEGSREFRKVIDSIPTFAPRTLEQDGLTIDDLIDAQNGKISSQMKKPVYATPADKAFDDAIQFILKVLAGLCILLILVAMMGAGKREPIPVANESTPVGKVYQAK